MPSTPSRTTVYWNLPADERQEFRLPALLKDHLARAAALTGQSLADYISTTLAERVSRDLAANTDWALTVDEQAELVRILASSVAPSARARAVAARADELFGRLTSTTGGRRSRG